MEVEIDDLLVTPVAARYAGVRAAYLRRLASLGRGPVPALRRGRGTNGGNYYTRAELDRWNAARKAKRGHLDA